MEEFGEVMWAASAYWQCFGEAAPLYPFVGQPELATALREAVQRGVPYTVESLARRLGMPVPPPDVEGEQ
jgi:hypothetical protein